MVRVEFDEADNRQTTVWLTPADVPTGIGMQWAASTIMGVMSGLATLIMWPGDRAAPIFAIAQAIVLALVMRHTWRRVGRYEKVVIEDDQVTVKAFPNGPHICFQSYWLKIGTEPGNNRLVMTSHGRRLEVGSFLNDDERRDASATVIALVHARRHANQEGGRDNS